MSEETILEADRLEGAPHPREHGVLVGHAEAEASVLRAWQSGRLPHAFLIGGPEGIGKATLAYRIARFVLAHPAPDKKPRKNLAVEEDHPVSRQVAALSHPDLLVLRRVLNDESGKLRTEIRVDDVRRIVSFFGSTAAFGGYRVCVVDSIEEMNAAGLNSLLKLVEEPPAKSIFLLISNTPGRVMATIRSRCQRMRLNPLSAEEVSQAVTALAARMPELSRAQIPEAAAASGGSVRRALELLLGEGLEVRSLSAEMLERLPSVDPAKLHTLGDNLTERSGVRRLHRDRRGLAGFPGNAGEPAARSPCALCRDMGEGPPRRDRHRCFRARPQAARVPDLRHARGCDPPLERGVQEVASMATKPRYYLTTAISYPNGVPHIGHAYEAIATDAIARFLRLDGHDVFFLTGTDEHGLKMAQTAAKEGITPRALADSNSALFQRDVRPARHLLRPFHPHHRARPLRVEPGDLAADGRGRRHLSRHLCRAGTRCATRPTTTRARPTSAPDNVRVGPQGTPVEWTEEKTYFFRLSAYQDRLLEALRRPTRISSLPETRRNEVISFVKGGLQDLSISRTTLRLGRAGAEATRARHVCLGRRAHQLPDRRRLSRREVAAIQASGRPICTSSARTSCASTRSTGRRS